MEKHIRKKWIKNNLMIVFPKNILFYNNLLTIILFQKFILLLLFYFFNLKKYQL